MATALMGKTLLDSSWLAARSTEVEATGVLLTTTAPPPGPSSPWMEAAIPGTVLGTLLKNKLVPDPFYGLNNESIVDIADSGREYYTFWFFTTFESKLAGNQHAYLNFRAINYSGEIYLNGHQMILPKGKIPLEGGQGGDHEIGKDVAAQYVEGWDWMTPIRDRNTGIWDEVSISITGPVKLSDPHLVSSFFDNYEKAYLHATVDLENKSQWPAECSLSIQVTAELDESTRLLEHIQTYEFSIPPETLVTYTIRPLLFEKPNLWWPNGMGKQFLYNIELNVEVKGFGESDSWSHPFGFRKIESTIDTTTGGRLFRVNGQQIFIRGGNWILSDGLLRLSAKRYMTDIKFHADMNFNMIRCWGGGLAERPEFYHYCDVYGVLVWQEFWITGDCDGRGVPISNPNGPLDHNLFLLCARDTIKLLRNHASLALWVGGNEQIPPYDINTSLINDLKLHPLFESTDVTRNLGEDLLEQSDDPSLYLDGTRAYIQGSMWDGFANGKGDFTDGPYEIQNPEDFFKDEFYQYGFNPEVGSVGMPVATTIRATMPPEALQIPTFQKLPTGYVEEIPNPTWEYHKYIPYAKPGKVHDQIGLYGFPKDLDDFCEKAQLVNYVQYKALLEGWTSRMWTKYTGVLIWKTQNPWTGLRGQFYDHLHDQTAGFYGCRSAAEPIHVQLNLSTFYIEVVNTTSDELSDIAIEVSVWDLDGKCPYYKITDKFSAAAKKVSPIMELDYPKSENAKPVYFLLLKLFRISDTNMIISRNFYWLHLPNSDYNSLELRRGNQIPLKITSQSSIAESICNIQIHVHNLSKNSNSSLSKILLENRKLEASNSTDNEGGVLRTVEVDGVDSGVAFFLHFSVLAAEVGDGVVDRRILPVHYSDNYFSLVPGEEMSINIWFEVSDGLTPQVLLEGWNYGGRIQVY